MARKFDGRPLLQVPHYGRTNVSPIGSCASTTQPQKKKLVCLDFLLLGDRVRSRQKKTEKKRFIRFFSINRQQNRRKIKRETETVRLESLHLVIRD